MANRPGEMGELPLFALYVGGSVSLTLRRRPLGPPIISTPWAICEMDVRISQYIDAPIGPIVSEIPNRLFADS